MSGRTLVNVPPLRRTLVVLRPGQKTAFYIIPSTLEETLAMTPILYIGSDEWLPHNVGDLITLK